MTKVIPDPKKPKELNTLDDQLDEILTKLENEVARDVALRMSQHRSGRSPKSSHAEAKAELLGLLAQADIQTLETLSAILHGTGGSQNVTAERVNEIAQTYIRTKLQANKDRSEDES